jgi:putative spermidine/putrescine transport system ATP-binding protein
MADRVCVMSRGRAEQIATPAELYSKPSTEFVAQFVGISSRVAVVRTGDTVALFGRAVKIRGEAPEGVESLDALLRPEDVDVVVAPTGLGIITHKSFLGATTRLAVGIGGAAVKADVLSSAADVFELGTRVDLVANARDVLVTTSRPTT